MKVGQILKQARKEKGISIKEVEEKTKIKTSFIESIESDDFSSIPGRIYTIGFLRSYAKFLGMNPEEIINIFKNEHPEKEPEPIPQDNFTLSNKKKNTAYYVIIACGLILLLSFGINYLLDREESEVNGVNDVVDTVPEVEEEEQQYEEPVFEEEETIEYEQAEVVVEIGDSNCWVEVFVDDQMEFSGLLEAGETYKYQGEKIEITFGNAAAANVTFNGEDQGIVGEAGQVVNKNYHFTN